MKLHHIGIVVKDIDNSIDIYNKLGYKKVSEKIIDNIQNNILIFLHNDISNETLELIQPMNKNSTVFNSKVGYNHFCYEVNNLDDYVESFKKEKIGKIFTHKITAPAFENKNIIFAILKNGTIIEFMEMK